MNRDLTLTEGDGSWPLGPYNPAQLPQAQEQASAMGLPRFLRIIREWRWLVLGVLAMSIAVAVAYTLLSTPLYRSWVTIEVYPPTVDVSEKESGEAATAPNIWEVVATQV